MKLGIQSNLYVDAYGSEKAIKMLVEHGYKAVDYQNLVNTDSEFFQMEEKAFESALNEYRSVYKFAGLEISQAHGPWRYPPRDFEPSDRAERFEAFCKAVRGTSYLGSKYMVVHPLMPYGDDSADNPEKVYEINFDFFSRLCAYAKDFGVTVCLENMPFLKLPISHPKAISEFVRSVGADNFKVCLDTGHANIFGLKQSEAIKAIGKDLLAALHIHDNDGKGDQHLDPFEGTIDWLNFGQALKDIDFDGVLSLETSTRYFEDSEAALNAHLKLKNSLNKIYNYTQDK